MSEKSFNQQLQKIVRIKFTKKKGGIQHITKLWGLKSIRFYQVGFRDNIIKIKKVDIVFTTNNTFNKNAQYQMSKRNSRHSSNLKENNQKIPQTDDIIEEKITKKQCKTSNTSTITSTTASESKFSAQEPLKMTLQELKNIKNMRKKQDHILMNIENDNIQKHVQGLIVKFKPPNCVNCPKINADRICINKQCGADRYMQLICSKCHFDEHQKCNTKSDIEIEQYFIKLASFMNEQKQNEKQANNTQRINLDNLEKIFEDIYLFRNKLCALRSKIQNEIEGYISPQEMHGILQNSITKALSLSKDDNIQEQLVIVKQIVIFEKNNFYWNDANEKFKSFQKIFTDLEKTVVETNKNISKSFIGGMKIDLNDIKFLVAPDHSLGVSLEPFKGSGDVIKIISGNNHSQYYMDYKLDMQKKYKFRFRFQSPTTKFIMIGIIPQSMVNSHWVYGVPNQYFNKRFLSSRPTVECSRIIKGKDLSLIPRQGMRIEMRIDFENNYMDFYDYPKINNINANHESQKFQSSDYVIAYAFYKSKTIVIESFEEVSSIDKLN